MRPIWFTLLLLIVLLLPGVAEARGRSARSARPYYGGGNHSVTHGGKYSGGAGSSHKAGSYRNPRTANRYGRHK